MMALQEMTGLGPWQVFTRLGESQILLPAAALVLVALLRQPGGRPLAGRWLVLLTVGVAMTTASKLAFIGWGIGSVALDFTGISGHAMFAAAIHPLLFGLLLPAGRPRARRLAVACGVVLALMVAVSRVVVQAHSVSEAAAGFLVGSGAGFVAFGLGSLARLQVGRWLLPAVAAWLACAALIAPPSPTHSMVTWLALRLSGHDEPYTREGLHAVPRQRLGDAQREKARRTVLSSTSAAAGFAR